VRGLSVASLERADPEAAVGVGAGAVMVDDCQPSRPVSVLDVHGTDDQLIPYLGATPSAPEAGLRATG
jgi:poly(3-hydroxybutyrate) depolymerase